MEFGNSINQHLQSTFYALCYERVRIMSASPQGLDSRASWKDVRPSLLGAAVQGETQIHQRVKAFKASLTVPGAKLYARE